METLNSPPLSTLLQTLVWEASLRSGQAYPHKTKGRVMAYRRAAPIMVAHSEQIISHLLGSVPLRIADPWLEREALQETRQDCESWWGGGGVRPSTPLQIFSLSLPEGVCRSKSKS